jgi:tetratricopeptide (TPR) repeat protein
MRSAGWKTPLNKGTVMSKASRYLVLVAILIVVPLVAVHFYLKAYPGNYNVVFVVALLFFIPGRVSSTFLKDLYLSRRFLNSERYAEAIEAGERFLETIKSQPWRRKLIYLTWSLYTWNVEAMARNNIGAASMMTGNFERARSELQAALTLDAGYALPYANLAAIEAAAGQHEESERLAELARQHGYSGQRTERLVDKVGALYATVQGGSR